MRARCWAVVLLVAGCSSGGVAVPAPSSSGFPAPTRTAATQVVQQRPVAAALRAYGSCPKLKQAVRREALADVTAYGLPRPARGRTATLAGGPLAAQPSAAGGTAWTGGSTQGGGPAAAPGFSATNNQEAGVDEPDLVKTDGKLLLVVQQRPPVLRILEVDGDDPELAGRLELPSALQSPEVLLAGSRALVLGSSHDGARMQTSVQVVDLKDPTSPEVERTFSIDGSVIDARLLRDRVVLAVQSTPDVPVTYPVSPSPADLRQALLINRRAVAHVADTNVLPSVTVQPGGQTYRSSCGAALHPGVPSGLGTTTLVTLDPSADKPTQTTTVVGNTTDLYASSTTVYLATSASNPRGAITTDLHGFDVTDPDNPRQLGSGSVPGTLLDRYALSSAHGDLRVATTVFERGSSDSRVTVLRPQGGVLATVGQVGGLGRGERIFGVRFLGDLGYVVTFRQTDPLYVVDVSDGANPRLRGELELTGFSSSLYPLDDDRLLGIGQSVGPQGGRREGLQLSVFDVASPDDPRLIDKEVIPDSVSTAQEDQHALLWWQPARLVVLPVSRYAGGVGAHDAMAYRVGADGGLTEAARISPPATGPRGPVGGPSRSLVIGDLLYSVTEQGLLTNRLDELSKQAWIPFP